MLAVFVGPIISASSTKDNMLGPMRQAWINELRLLLAEITSKCLHYFQAGFEDRSDDEYLQITNLEHRIIFMLNAQEDDHTELIYTIRNMVRGLETGKNGVEDFIDSYEKLIKDGRLLLKKEWEVVKGAKSKTVLNKIFKK